MYRGSLIDKNGVWKMVIYHYENGKRKFVWETTHLSSTINRNKGKAQRMLDDRLRELNTVPSRDNFVGFMGEWLTDIQRRVRPNTYNSYALVVNTHLIPYFQPLDLDGNDASVQGRFRDDYADYGNSYLRGISKRTVHGQKIR